MTGSPVGSRALRIVLAGRMVAAPAQGGAAWAVLQWLLGLAALGHDVTFIEPLPEDRMEPRAVPLHRTANATAFESIVRRFGLVGSSALVATRSGESVGLAGPAVRQAIQSADLLVNLSGVLSGWEGVEEVPVRLYVDVDPGFTQVWHASGDDVGLAGHTHFATLGPTLGEPDSPFPDPERHWLGILPPVFLSAWTRWPAPARGDYTTVANWRSYGTIERDGLRFGQKAHAFRQLAALPRLVGTRFRLALAIDPAESADLELLAANGWDIVDAASVAATPDAYQEFIRGSRAELAVAKTGYTVQPLGWFSDRSACYLATGRPVVAQDTGWSRFLPEGEGLLRFGTLEEAAEAVRQVERDYERHAAAAAAVARDHLASEVVLGALLRAIGVTP